MAHSKYERPTFFSPSIEENFSPDEKNKELIINWEKVKSYAILGAELGAGAGGIVGSITGAVIGLVFMSFSGYIVGGSVGMIAGALIGGVVGAIIGALVAIFSDEHPQEPVYEFKELEKFEEPQNFSNGL